MRPISNKSLIWLVCVLFAAKLVMLVVLAVNTRFVMDEFWQFGQSKYLWAGFYDTIWPVKSVGYALWYWPAHWVGWDAASTLVAGRLLAVGTVLATLGVLFATSRALGFSRISALVSLVLLLSVSTYMERSFRVRSETPAILCSALSLWVVVAGGGLPRPGRIALAGVLTGCAFLCTQKAVYFNGALGLGLVAAFWLHGTLPRAVSAAAALLAGWAVALLSYSLVFGGSNALAVLRQLVFGPANLAMSGGELFSDLDEYIWQTLNRNILIYGIFLIGLLLAMVNLTKNSPEITLAAVFTAVLTVLVFSHNQPWPYVFAMCLPFLSLWTPVFLSRVMTHATLRVAAVGIFVLVVLYSFGRNVSYFTHENHWQLEVIRTAESLIGPDGTYFDGIGMLPTHFEAPRSWLDKPAIARIETGQVDIVAALASTPPDLIIETYRTDRLPAAYKDWVERRYVALAPGLLVPGTVVPASDPVTLTVVKPGRFTLEDPSHRLILDGVPAHLPVDLAPGIYSLMLDGTGGPTRLFPDGLAVPERQKPRFPLFRAVYSR